MFMTTTQNFQCFDKEVNHVSSNTDDCCSTAPSVISIVTSSTISDITTISYLLPAVKRDHEPTTFSDPAVRTKQDPTPRTQTQANCIAMANVSKDSKWNEYRAHMQRRTKKEITSDQPQSSDLKKRFSLHEYKKYIQKDSRPALNPQRRASSKSQGADLCTDTNKLRVNKAQEGSSSTVLIPILLFPESKQARNHQGKASPPKKRVNSVTKSVPSCIKVPNVA